MTSDSFGKENRSVPARRGSAHVQTKIRIGVCLMCVFGFLWRASKVRWKEGHKIGRRCWKSPNFAIFLKSGYSKLNSCYGALMRLGDRGKAWGHCPLTLIERAQWFNFLNPLLDPCPPVQSLGSQVVQRHISIREELCNVNRFDNF